MTRVSRSYLLLRILFESWAFCHDKSNLHRNKVCPESSLRRWTLIIQQSGATCSGKTTLAMHLFSLFPNSIILHQDVSRSFSGSAILSSHASVLFRILQLYVCLSRVVQLPSSFDRNSLKNSFGFTLYTTFRTGTQPKGQSHGIDLSIFWKQLSRLEKYPGITEALTTSTNLKK